MVHKIDDDLMLNPVPDHGGKDNAMTPRPSGLYSTASDIMVIMIKAPTAQSDNPCNDRERSPRSIPPAA